MLPPGRRRAHAVTSPWLLCLALFLLFASTAQAATSVLGIDFGTLNFKAVLVKPGIPFEIVLTKDSKRKESAAVAFKPAYDAQKNVIAEVGKYPERAYGGDALALQARFPAEVFLNLKPMLGLVSSETGSKAVEQYTARYPAVQAAYDSATSTSAIKSSAFVADEALWNVEELLAMQLANVKQNAENLAGGKGTVRDVVITVPAFYTAEEKQAIQRAATLAGLEVNALVTDGLAVGLDYAKSRTFPEVTKGEKPEYHIIFDMGAGSTTATVLRMQSRSVKDYGRHNKTVQEVAVLGTGFDRTLGGDALNDLVLADYISKFVTKPAMKDRGLDESAVRQNARAMSRLWKDAEKARQVLSANTETTSSFEELLPDVDFKAKLTRTEFEELASGFADRIANPIKDALTAAKLEMADIDSVILHGGVVRTPFVQRKLEEIAGDSAKLRSNVNSDESAVFGAAFKGAGLSSSFKVKEIRDSDIAMYPVGMTYTDGEKKRKQILFSPVSPVGNGASTKQVTFKDKDDFSFAFYQQVDDVEHIISRIATQNLTASVKALKDKFGCEKDEISTKFSIKMSPTDGLPSALSGFVSCEVEGSGKAESIGDSVKGWLGLGKKNKETPGDGEEDTGPVEEVEASNPASTAEKTTATNKTASKTPEKPKIRTETIPLSFTTTPEGKLQPSAEELSKMRRRLMSFDRSDRARFAREEALNVLESYTYFVRDFLSNTDYEVFSTAQVREEIQSLQGATREFLEDHKEVAQSPEETLRSKLQDLKALIEPIQARRKEEFGRFETVAGLKKSLNQTEKLISKVRDTISSASSKAASASEAAVSAASSLAEAAASSLTETSSSPSPSPSPSSETDALDDLEERETSTSSTTISPPIPSSFFDFSQYTDYDLTRLEEAFETASNWLTEQESAQEKLATHEDPVLLVADIAEHSKTLGALLREMSLRKLQPPIRPMVVRSKKSSSKTKKSKTSSSATTVGEESSSSTMPVTEETEVPTTEEVPVEGGEEDAKEENKRDEL